jgi:glycosyltransferase involved in cell wall biosynthesis
MKFTVFTPTYNRAHTITRVYESLLEQTYKDFEWLVIDDGSTDCTCNLIAHLQNCVGKAFPIRYHGQTPNRGKHIAHNRALKEAQGEFLLVADSDDWIVPNALERMVYHWVRLPIKTDYGGVCGLCADRNGNIIGSKYTKAMIHSTLRDRKYIHKMKGEHWGFVRTDIAKQYPFPDHIDGFVPEGVVWLDIAKKYKDYCVNEVFRIYNRK